jgi:tetratricopeptide (TPR) repeat protein
LLDQALDGIWELFWRKWKLHDGIGACQLAVDAAGQVDAAAPEYPDAQRVLARAAIHQALMHSYLGHSALARRLLDRAAKLLDGEALAGHDTRAERAFLLMRTGEIRGRLDKAFAERSLQAAAALFREIGNRHAAAMSLYYLGRLYGQHNEIDAAISATEEGLAFHRDRGNDYGIGSFYFVLAELAHARGDYELEIQHCHHSLARFRASGSIFELGMLNQLAHVQCIGGDFDLARELYAESLSAARSRNQILYETEALFGLGVLAMHAFDVQEAGRRFTDALTFAQEHQYDWGVAYALAALGHVSSFQGDFDTGADYGRQSAAILRARDQRYDEATALYNVATAEWLSGAFDQAASSLRQAQALAGEGAGWHIETLHTVRQCQLQLYSARYEEAIIGAREVLRQAGDMKVENAFRRFGIRAAYTPRQRSKTAMIAQAHGVLGWAALAERRYREATQELVESVAAFREVGDREHEAWALAGLGCAAHGSGKLSEVRTYLLTALATVVEIGAFVPLLHLLPVIAVALVNVEDSTLKERAAELHGLATSQPLVAKSPLFEDVAGRYVKAATATLPPDVVEAAQARGRALDWWETAEVLLDELCGLGWSATGVESTEV